MKYIKKFNEELLPSTYRSAAYRFKQYNKSQSNAKAHKLEDWANQQEFGLYNMHFVCGTIKVVTGTFTQPKLISIYYGRVPGGRVVSDDKYVEFIKSNNLLNSDSTDSQAEKLINDWAGGDNQLSITFEFGFRPTNETLNASKNHSWLANTQKSGRYLHEVPSFSVELLLSDWDEGLEEWDSEHKWQCEHDGREFVPSGISEMFEYSNYNQLTLQQPLCNNYSALFSDRKSAAKFLTFFQQTMQSEKVKDVIMDVLRVIGAETQHLENVLNAYKNVRVHGLYDESPTTGKDFRGIWFNKRID
jgi:hypothetical protein